ncbi:MAG TPA: hemerythrin family protein [bacterium]|nr:hemerythrin family protein [bacterium]
MGDTQDWGACQSVGVPECDADHADLLALARALRSALNDHAPATEVQALLDDLLEQTLGHFEREERMLANEGYPELARHISSHNRLLRAMLHFKEDVRYARYRSDVAVKFIHAWVVEHVRVEDARYGAFLRERRAEQATESPSALSPRA